MAIPRHETVPPGQPGIYHCTSRCARALRLCGSPRAHLKAWLQSRLIDLNAAFAIDTLDFNFLDNHFHLLERVDPQSVERWSDEEVTERWGQLFPRSIQRWAQELTRPRRNLSEARLAEMSPSRRAAREKRRAHKISPAQRDRFIQLRRDDLTYDHDTAIQIVSHDTKRVAILRERLSNLSWFMRCLKHDIAVRANRESGDSGCFWDGRFHAKAITSEKQLLHAMFYVNQNQVRAGIAATLEDSDWTSFQDRLAGRDATSSKAAAFAAARRANASEPRPTPTFAVANRSSCAPSWMPPIDLRDDPRGFLNMSFGEYILLNEASARVKRHGKVTMDPSVPPILERLGLTEADLIEIATLPVNLRAIG